MTDSDLDPTIEKRLRFDDNGLITAVVKQYDSDEVLMVAYMNAQTLLMSMTTGRATYWSRSRRQIWRKGDTSGHVQYVKSIRMDCDGDALLVEVDQVGAACHTGARSCFLTSEPFPVVVGEREEESHE